MTSNIKQQEVEFAKLAGISLIGVAFVILATITL